MKCDGCGKQHFSTEGLKPFFLYYETFFYCEECEAKLIKK